SAAAPGICSPRRWQGGGPSGEAAEEGGGKPIGAARRLGEEQRRLGELEFEQARAAGGGQQVHPRVRQRAERERREGPLRRRQLLRRGLARLDAFGLEKGGGRGFAALQQGCLADGVAELALEEDQ